MRKKFFIFTFIATIFISCGSNDTNESVKTTYHEPYPSDILIAPDNNKTEFDIVKGLYKQLTDEENNKVSYLLITSSGKFKPYSYDLKYDCAQEAKEYEANYIFKDKQLIHDINESNYWVKIENYKLSWVYDENKTINYINVKSAHMDINISEGVYNYDPVHINLTVKKSKDKIYLCQ